MSFVDAQDPDAFRRALRPNTKAFYGEGLGNPALNIFPFEEVAKIAKESGVPLIIDNTVASPYLCNPLALGADIVVHSATKYIGGHGTTMGGVVVEGGKFPWDNGNFPEMVEPSRAYHGVKFYETFGDFGYTMKARMEVNRTFGGVLSPMNAWQLLQGAETLDSVAPMLPEYEWPKARHWAVLGDLAPITWSCRRPLPGGLECGKCHACTDRAAAMRGTSDIAEVRTFVEETRYGPI